MEHLENDPSTSQYHRALPRKRPAARQALICFLICSFCLAWLASLQWQRNEQMRAAIPAPAASEPKPAPKPRPIKLIEAPSTRKGRVLSESDYSVAEVEIVRALTDANAIEFKHAAAVLRPYTFSTNDAVRGMASREYDAAAKKHDKALLKTLTSSIDEAKALAEKKNFVGALDGLRAALKKVPPDGSLSNEGPETIIRALIEDFELRRQKAHDAIFKGLDDGVRKKQPEALARLEAALNDTDPTVRDDAKALQERLADEADAAAAAARNLERNARDQWVRFFKRFSGTVADGDYSSASDLCENPPFDVILKGGSSDPNKILKLCSADVQAIQTVYDEALADAKGTRRAVSFHLRKGGQAAGTLIGVNGKLLRINPGKGAELGVKISDLTSEGIKAILDSGIKRKPTIRLALAALEAYENSAEAERIITEAYAKENQELPFNWSERFRIEKLVAKIAEAEQRLAALKKAIDAGIGDEVKVAVENSKAIVAELREMNALSEDTRKLFSAAEKVAAKKQMSTVILQNGVSPDAAYKGINTDQISEYRDSVRRTDVGVGYGLRLGAAGGLQRALIKFDGLETTIGNGRVRKATLELYQISSPKSENASVGIFRVKRAWIPDSGSWLGYDSQKGHDWAIPGASGADDIEAREDSNMILDKKVNVWRQLDVTKYVQDVMGGKAQNNGLLLKVVNGEPDYHVRFYPETDLDAGKDKTLRPKLTLELLRDTE